MVNPFVVRILIQVIKVLGETAIKAYKQSASKQGNKVNPFAEFVQQTMQSANLTHRPIFRSDAVKILYLEEKEVNPETILTAFWRQFHKNDPVKGGSYYIQSMLFNAKCELMKDFPEADEKLILEKIKESNESTK